MPFKLNNAPIVFSRSVVVAFKGFIHNFLEVHLNDWTMFILLNNYLEILTLMLDICKQLHITLNLKNCIVHTPFRVLLGHVMCNE
jgi:hypothetical protein